MKKALLTISALALCVGAFAEETVGIKSDAATPSSTETQTVPSVEGLEAEAQPVAAQEAKKTKKSKEKKEKSEFAKHMESHFKFYGFIRNYLAYDNRNGVAGTGDLYYWIPQDVLYNDEGVDLNAQNQMRYLSLTSRVGVDVSGYKVGKTSFGAKIEADFYAGLTKDGGTAQLRLRQAYATIGWENICKGLDAINMKLGQAWHPMAADLPDIFSLESGAPFNAFSRTPMVSADFSVAKHWIFTAALIWQMQYRSTGPLEASYTYMKYSCVPEVYLGVTYKHQCGFLGRVGVDILSIKPYNTRSITYIDESGQPAVTVVNVKDRISTASPYIYLQYTKGLLKLKGKTIYGSAGEHINLMSGYAICDQSDPYEWKYTPLHSSSTWVTVSYGKKVNGALLLGYMENLGTYTEIVANKAGKGDVSSIFFQPNGTPNIKRMLRFQPEVTYNIGKFTIGLEYMLTSVNYGEKGNYNLYALSLEDLHWVTNHRIQAMFKFSF